MKTTLKALALTMLQKALAQDNSTDVLPQMDRGLREIKNMLEELSCAAGQCVSYKGYQRILRDYGCNCFPEDENAEWDGIAIYQFESHGEPVDELDSACKEAYKRYRCFTHDVDNGLLSDATSCMPGMEFEFHMSSNEIICGPPEDPEYALNSDLNGCKLAACEIERAFSYRVFNIVGNELNPSGKKLRFREQNAHNFGTHGRGECKAQTGGDKDSCCGEFPNRKPFNSDMASCCDGDIVTFGSC